MNHHASADPSLWIQSSWRGEQTLEQACKVVTKDLKEYVGAVGLFVVYGSWNWNARPSKNHNNGLMRLLDALLHPHARLDTHYTTGMVQVDSCDDELEVCCGDSQNDKDHHLLSLSLPLPCPPEQLPVLLLVLRRSSMKQPEIRYLSSMTSSEILKHWKNGNKTTRTTTTTTTEIMIPPDAVQQEIQHSLQSFGLVATSTIPPSSFSLNKSHQQQQQQQPALRIFVGGDRMSVGKTSVCLGLLGNLVRLGYPTESLAYIKPATQNEKPQLVQKYCERMGIACVPIGPIVYYRGFTRAYLMGETETSLDFLRKVEAAVDTLARGKKVVIVDGVGFPAVGSICGTDNASVAKASGYPSEDSGTSTSTSTSGKRRRPIGVVLVGGSGVGGAVDAFNLNATYFERAQVPVLGAIFNKLSLDGYYSLENCKTQITSYFAQNEHQLRLGRQAYGFVPLYAGIADDDKAMDHVFDFLRLFGEHVDMEAILEAATKVRDQSFPMEMDIDDGERPESSTAAVPSRRPTKRFKAAGKRDRSREEIENNAIQAGAAPSA
jgi:dethiobiotin synthetase